jgi:DNA primase
LKMSKKTDRLVFDLDPDKGLGFDAVVRAALEFRELLTQVGLITFPMADGPQGRPTPLVPANKRCPVRLLIARSFRARNGPL